MPVQGHTRDEAIDANLAAFIEALPRLLPAHRGQYALMRFEEVLAFHPTLIDAQIEGNRTYADRLFSVQKVTDTAKRLGAFAYAVDPRPA